MNKAQGSLEYLLLIGGVLLVAIVVITLLYIISESGIGGTDTSFRDVLWQQLSTGSKIKDGSFEDPAGGPLTEFGGSVSTITDSYFNGYAVDLAGGNISQGGAGSHLAIFAGKDAKGAIWAKGAGCTFDIDPDGDGSCTASAGNPSSITDSYEKHSFDCSFNSNFDTLIVSGDCIVDGLILKAS
ncbi:MAG: class III signal peptide-containing protein [Candidatus Diapherotrites archaeon]